MSRFYRNSQLDGDRVRLLLLLPGIAEEPIRCRTKEVSLSDSPRYSAVSYTWGVAEDGTFNVSLNDQDFQVQRNLRSVLKRLRRPDEGRVLWIDAICINQSNIPERNQQVGVMGRIYAQAECVLAWLGEATDGSNLAMQTLRKFDDTKSAENMSTATDWRVDGQYDQDDLALVEMLCNREYWQRTWVIQEVLLAQKLEIICGGYSVSWKSFAAFTRHLQHHGLKTFSPNYALSSAVGREPSHETYMPYDLTALKQTSAFRILDHKLDGHSFANLSEVLEISASSKCRDPRDKVYAVLALIDAEATVRSLVIDYRKRLRQLYLDVMKSCEADHTRDVSSDLFGAAHELAEFAIVLKGALGLARPELPPRQQKLQSSASKRIIPRVCRVDWYNKGFGRR